MLNGLRDGQINYGTTNCPSAHVPPRNVVAPLHQNSSIMPTTEPAPAPVVYPWNSNARIEHLYGFHSRYYNLDFPTPYPPPPDANQYVPTNVVYGQNVQQCCQPCCRLRSQQSMPKTSSPPQMLYNPIRPVQQVMNHNHHHHHHRPYKPKKNLKTLCPTEQFLPYIPNDLPPPVKYDAQNYYQQKYGGSSLSSSPSSSSPSSSSSSSSSSSYLNSATNCCAPPMPPTNNLWMPPTVNPPPSAWSADRLRPPGRHTVGGGMMAAAATTQDYNRDKNYQRLPNHHHNYPAGNNHHPYSSNLMPGVATHASRPPYNYVPPAAPDLLHDYRSPTYHPNPSQSKNNNTPVGYVAPPDHGSRRPVLPQNNQSGVVPPPQYYNSVQPTPPYPPADVQRKPDEQFTAQMASSPASLVKSNLNVRDFLANWDEGEEETGEKPSSETTAAAAPIVVLDCMTLEGDALTKIQEKLNVVSYENLEKVLKDNQQNPLMLGAESDETDSVHVRTKLLPAKPNFEPLDYTKRETGIIKPFVAEKKTSVETHPEQPDKSYSVNFDGMVAWYGKKNTDISSTDLIERLADRIFNLSKSQENEGVSFGTAAYTGQITQTNRSIENVKDSSKYVHNQQMFGLQQHPDKFIEPSVVNKPDGHHHDSVSKPHCCVLNENNSKMSPVKSNNVNSSSCIVENVTKKCLNMCGTNEESISWNLDHGSQEQHLNMSLYDNSVIIKPLDFSSLTDETKGNPFAFDKNTPCDDKPNDIINDHQFSRVLNGNNNYHHPAAVSNTQRSIQQIDSSNRNFPVIVSPHMHRQDYNGFHGSVIQRTGCDKNKHDKAPSQADFESMNWSITNDLDKIMKNTNIAMEPSPYLYERNNYSILDAINSNKTVSTPWKDTVPCVDLKVNNKTNTNHDPFFDGWNFIDSYENHSNKKITNASSGNSEVHDPLFPNQMTPLEQPNNSKNNSVCKKGDNETSSVGRKDVSYLKPSDLSSNSTARSRDVFNLNSRIPDFSDGFELTATNELHEYMQFKKSSNNDHENRTDGSIFEHLTEPSKCARLSNETSHAKNEQNKPDIVGLPSFKEKEPLAPMPVPPKLNIVKPIIRDPSQIYTVIKQKQKHDHGNNACADHDSMLSNKTELGLRDNQPNAFNGTDAKSKYNGQLNQFDVWSEKFILKNSSNNSTIPVVQCDVEITQFKSTHENRNSLTPKPPTACENYQDKNAKTPENADCNLSEDKMNENNKINSNDFLNCLESTKTNDQKYRDPLDEFETSFGFDIHCNNESNKSFHEDIVDKCLEERLKDQIGEHDMNAASSTNALTANMSSSNNVHLPFQCDFQSGYLIKNYFDENKNKAFVLDQKQSCDNTMKSRSTTTFDYHSEIEHGFELQNNKHIRTTQNSVQKTEFNIMNLVNRDMQTQIKNNITKEGRSPSNFLHQTDLKLLDSNHQNIDIDKMSPMEKNNLNYLTMETRGFDFKNNNESILESTSSEKVIGINDHSGDHTDVCKINYNNNDSNMQKLSNVQKHSENMNIDFELSINRTNIFPTNSHTTSGSAVETNAKCELENTADNGFNESTFHSENDTENIDHQVGNKNIFELENNSDLYQTESLEKIPEFDFESRIIQNFEIECSDSGTVRELKSPMEVFTSKNQTDSDYHYETNDGENKERKEFKNSSFDILDEPLTESISNVDCTSSPRNAIDTKNVNLADSKIDQIFEVGCCSDTQTRPSDNGDYDIRDEMTEKINLNNDGDVHGSNSNCTAQVENIFEELYDNLAILNAEKDDVSVSENFRQNDDGGLCDRSKSMEKINDGNLKIDVSGTVMENCDPPQIDECFIDKSHETFVEAGEDILLEEFGDISTSRGMAVFSQQTSESLKEKEEEKEENTNNNNNNNNNYSNNNSNNNNSGSRSRCSSSSSNSITSKGPTSEECNARGLDDENVLNDPNKRAENGEYVDAFREGQQRSDIDVKQGWSKEEIERQNGAQTVQSMTTSETTSPFNGQISSTSTNRVELTTTTTTTTTITTITTITTTTAVAIAARIVSQRTDAEHLTSPGSPIPTEPADRADLLTADVEYINADSRPCLMSTDADGLTRDRRHSDTDVNVVVDSEPDPSAVSPTTLIDFDRSPSSDRTESPDRRRSDNDVSEDVGAAPDAITDGVIHDPESPDTAARRVGSRSDDAVEQLINKPDDMECVAVAIIDGVDGCAVPIPSSSNVDRETPSGRGGDGCLDALRSDVQDATGTRDDDEQSSNEQRSDGEQVVDIVAADAGSSRPSGIDRTTADATCSDPSVVDVQRSDWSGTVDKCTARGKRNVDTAFGVEDVDDGGLSSSIDGVIVERSASRENSAPDGGSETNSGELRVTSSEWPRVKFSLKRPGARVLLAETNVFDKMCSTIAPGEKPPTSPLISGSIFKRNDLYRPWRNVVLHNRRQLWGGGGPIRNAAVAVRTSVNAVATAAIPVPDTSSFVMPAEHLDSDHSGDGGDGEEPADLGWNNDAGRQTPVPSPFDDFVDDFSPAVDDEYWDKSLENEYNNVLYKTISKLTTSNRRRTTTNIRDKFDIRLMARRCRRRRRQRRWRQQQQQLTAKRCQRRRPRQKRSMDETTTGDRRAVVVGPAAGIVKTAATAVATATAVSTAGPRCMIKVQLPWGRIFNLTNSRWPNDGRRRWCKSDTKLELGPAKVEVRLSRTPGEWQVATTTTTTTTAKTAAAAISSSSSSSPQLQPQPVSSHRQTPPPPSPPSESTVVSVRRLVLQRADDHGYCCCFNRSRRHVDNDDDGDDDQGGCCSNGGGVTTDGGDDGMRHEERSRKLPKIVIRRNGRDNNYTSYVSSGGSEEGGVDDGGGDTPRLIVRLVRDRKLDAMAVDGITTLHLKHIVPIAESVAATAPVDGGGDDDDDDDNNNDDNDDDDDTNGSVKRVRYS